MNVKDHNKKILSQWEKELNDKNAKAWFILAIDDKWKNTSMFVDVMGVDLPKNLRAIADTIERNKKKGGHA